MTNQIENANISRGTGKLDPRHFTPMPKNPNITKFFREIGLADELGSGMRNLMKYGQVYGGEIPQLLEGDVFTVMVLVIFHRFTFMFMWRYLVIDFGLEMDQEI